MKRSYPVLEDLSRSLASVYQTIPPSVGGAPYLRVLRDGTHFLTVLEGAKPDKLFVKYYAPHHKEEAGTLKERLKRILGRGANIEVVGDEDATGLGFIASLYSPSAPVARDTTVKSHHKIMDPSMDKIREERAAHKISRYEALGKILTVHPDIGKSDILVYMAKAGYKLSLGEYQRTIADLRTALPDQGKELRVKGIKKNAKYRVVRKSTRQP